MAKELNKISLLGIDEAFYSGFQRSLRGLLRSKSPTLVVNSRQLRDLNEVIQIYPFSTRQLQIKEARSALIPILSRVPGAGHRLFSDSSSEEHIVSQRAHTHPEDHTEARRQWGLLSVKILGILKNGGAEATQPLINLQSRGAQLMGGVFESIRIDTTIRKSLSQLSKNNHHNLQLVASVAADIEKWVNQFIPIHDIERAELKAHIYHFVDFANHQKSALKVDIKHWLLREAPDIVKNLAGHVSAPQGQVPKWNTKARPMEFSPIMDKLLQRDVLKSFKFISATES